MTRKDFVLIAGVLYRKYQTAPTPVIRDLIDAVAVDMAVQIKSENRNFNMVQFVEAVRTGATLPRHETRGLSEVETPEIGVIEIGQGATWSVRSDRYPATVVDFTRFRSGPRKGQVRTVTVKGDEWTVISGSELDGSAKYTYKRNPRAAERVYTVDTKGRFMRNGSRLTISTRRRYYDPHV